jgi:predicted phage tail protein
MKTILLYGFLGRRFGRVHRYDVKSPAEAVRAMCVTLTGFRRAVEQGGSYRMVIGGKESLDVDGLQSPVSDRETIRLIPAIAGAGGAVRAIIGAILIVVSFFVPIPGLAQLGVALVVGGVSEMLFTRKAPGTVERPENLPSYTFDGAVNTAAQGNPVPVFYGGPLIIGSQVVSAGLSVEQI